MFNFNKNMNISKTTNQQVNFNSKKLYNLTLDKTTIFDSPQKLTGFISELGAEDIPRLEKNIEDWEETLYGNDIIKNLKNRIKRLAKYPKYVTEQHFYAVEIPQVAQDDKIITLAETSVGKKQIMLNLLQSSNAIDITERIYGGGSGILYTITKLADSLGLERIKLEADEAAIDFYEKNNFEPMSKKYYVLCNDLFHTLTQKLEHKYKISKVE